MELISERINFLMFKHYLVSMAWLDAKLKKQVLQIIPMEPH